MSNTLDIFILSYVCKMSRVFDILYFLHAVFFYMLQHSIPFFLLITKDRKERVLSRACHFFRSGASTLDLGFWFAVSSMQEEKGYSSSLSKWLFPCQYAANSFAAARCSISVIQRTSLIYHRIYIISKIHCSPKCE